MVVEEGHLLTKVVVNSLVGEHWCGDEGAKLRTVKGRGEGGGGGQGRMG